MKRKAVSFLKKLRKNFSKYLSTNRLYLFFVLFALIDTVILRANTVANTNDYKPFICDLALIVIIGSFGYFVKPKKQFNYYFCVHIIITFLFTSN